MQGLFLNGGRAKSKAEVRRFLADGGDPYGVVIEATSMFGDEFDGSLAKAALDGKRGPFYVVGPDPYRDRRWYGTVEFKDGKGWVIK